MAPTSSPRASLTPYKKVEYYFIRPIICIGILFIAYTILRDRISTTSPDSVTQITQVLSPSKSISDSSSKSLMDAKYPDLYILEPREKHENTILLLHGTSQDGKGFGQAFLNFQFPIQHTATPEQVITKTISQLFPETRFVFPTGKKRWSTVLGRESHAWFDFQSFSDRTINESIQIGGLAESAVYLGELVDAEVEVLLQQTSARSPEAEESRMEDVEMEKERKRDARRKIVVGGFSQGSAMAVIALLAGKLGGFEGGQIGGLVGLSGWCPFRLQILTAISSSEKTFHGPGDLTRAQKYAAAMVYLVDLLGLKAIHEKEKIAVREHLPAIPVFLGHGQDDMKMKVHWGSEMGDLLRDLGLDVQFKAYEGLEHWWNEEEMVDLVGFLREVWSVDPIK